MTESVRIGPRASESVRHQDWHNCFLDRERLLIKEKARHGLEVWARDL